MEEKLNQNEFLESMRKILVRILNVEKITIPINFETKLVDGVGEDGIDLSSIDYVSFLIDIENKYDIVYDFDIQIYTLGDIYNYIQEYKMKESRVENE